MAKVEITGKGGKTEIIVDGVKLNGVVSMNLAQAVSTIPMLRVDIPVTAMNVDIDDAYVCEK